jgi:hypothetical protein
VMATASQQHSSEGQINSPVKSTDSPKIVPRLRSSLLQSLSFQMLISLAGSLPEVEICFQWVKITILPTLRNLMLSSILNQLENRSMSIRVK